MKKDLLVIYARNHGGTLFNNLTAMALFLPAKYKLYGLPHGWLEGGRDAAIVLFCMLMLQRLSHLLRRDIVARRETLQEKDVGARVLEICLNKALFMLPWLLLLFWPLKSDYIYDHLLGYVFVFAVTAVYASASAPLLSLLIFDIALLMLPAAAVTLYNGEVQETRYVGGALLLFSAYAFIIGNKIRRSTIQLVESRQRAAQSARRADEASRAKSSFLALMSHEIRTPMTGIFGMIDFLKETELSAEQKEFVVTIRECSKTLLNTLNDILDLSKIESGKLGISRINYDFAGTLQNSVRVLQQLAEDKGLTLTAAIAGNIPPLVHGDPHRTQQVVLNLLNNAVKFTDKGGVSLKAAFIEGAAPRLRVEVADTGIGVGKENIGKLFGVFSQADASISRRYGGSGLGLSITKSLVELMGGKIGVTSEEGKGSTFWFELPYAAPVEGANDAFEEEQQDAEAPLPPQRILLAEDNLVNQEIVTKLLRRKGHLVTVVGDGEEAIKAAAAADFDLILMDINMPKKNGLETTREIRALGRKHRKIPIIGLTANIMEDFVKKCREAGMADFIAKPFAPKKLYGAIARQVLDAATREKAAAAAQAPVVRPLKETLAAIAAETDAEYLRATVASSTKEIRRLSLALHKAFRGKDYPAVMGAAHDLKSLTGMIGLQRSCSICFTIEDCCNKGAHQGLLGLTNDLDHWLGRELKDLDGAMKEYKE